MKKMTDFELGVFWGSLATAALFMPILIILAAI